MPKVILRTAMGGLVLLLLVASLSCGYKHTLVAITVTPNGSTVTNPPIGFQLHFTATGEFVHPPGQRDITNQVAWSTPAPVIFSIDPKTGIGTYQGGCGTNLPVVATASTNLQLPPSGNIVSGTATISIAQVNCP
jgi:hypothetical protein